MLQKVTNAYIYIYLMPLVLTEAKHSHDTAAGPLCLGLAFYIFKTSKYLFFFQLLSIRILIHTFSSGSYSATYYWFLPLSCRHSVRELAGVF